MRTYARIDEGGVAEIFSTENDIANMFNPALVWVEVTDLDPEPQERWLASYADGAWSFVAPTVATPTLDDIKAALCVSVDAAADTAYITIGGPSPGRLAEYQQAKADATAFKDAGYAVVVPGTVACWAQAAGFTAKEACDDILATALQWEAALVGIRTARLLGKASVNAAAMDDDARATANAVIASILSVSAGL